MGDRRIAHSLTHFCPPGLDAFWRLACPRRKSPSAALCRGCSALVSVPYSSSSCPHGCLCRAAVAEQRHLVPGRPVAPCCPAASDRRRLAPWRPLPRPLGPSCGSARSSSRGWLCPAAASACGGWPRTPVMATSIHPALQVPRLAPGLGIPNGPREGSACPPLRRGSTTAATLHRRLRCRAVSAAMACGCGPRSRSLSICGGARGAGPPGPASTAPFGPGRPAAAQCWPPWLPAGTSCSLPPALGICPSHV